MTKGRWSALIVAAAFLATGCDDGSGATEDDWDPDAQFAPSLRPAFGARVDDGRLQFWTGTPCHDVTRIRVVFDPYTSASTEAVLMSPDPGATVEEFEPTGAVEGFEVVQALPRGFDWTGAETATFEMEGSDFQWGSTVELDEVEAGSGDHDADTYHFQDVGWLDADEVAADNGETFLTPCTDDPEDQPR